MKAHAKIVCAFYICLIVTYLSAKKSKNNLFFYKKSFYYYVGNRGDFMKSIKLLFAALLMLSFSACDSEENKGQVYSEHWSYDKNNHWHDAISGDPVSSDKGPHVLSDWKVETPSTEALGGLKYKECETCGYRIYEALPQKLEFVLNDDNASYAVRAISRNLEGSIEIPSVYNNLPVTRIDEKGFYLCDKLTSITLPDTIVSIGDSGFCFCKLVVSFNIPGSVTTIGNNAFSNCKSLKSFSMPDSVVNIGYQCFDECDARSQLNYQTV